MCCRMVISPLDKVIAEAVLTIGMFTDAGLIGGWRRDLPDEGTTVFAKFLSDGSELELSISPSVSNYDQHAQKRLAAGVYFEIAAKYAEKVGGSITQLSVVAGCKDTLEPANHVAAQYPEHPLLFEGVCPGFRETFLQVAP